MASSFKLRRFSRPATLKAISPRLLSRFLDPYREFLAGCQFELNDRGDFDYDTLAHILMSPAEDTPDELLDALFFVDEMSLDGFFEDLMTEARTAGVDLDDTEEFTAADLAVRLWLVDRNALERMHAERFLVKRKSFESFLSTGSDLPDVPRPSDASIQALENDLNDWFETRKRGRGTRVFPFVREDGVWFLVRHGEPYRREGTLEHGEPSSIFFRPEKFDVLIYNTELGELAIHAGTKGEKKAYCAFFGKHIFGSSTFFDVDGTEGKFSLQPIIVDGRACLTCSDIEGINEIRLSELQFRHDSYQYHVEVHKADDVFTALEEIDRTIPASAMLVRAGFKVRFSSAVRSRTVVIRPPTVAVFDRESDADLVSTWLMKRGFIRTATGTRNDEAHGVLQSS